ncbi:MAG: hypothetical protein P8011_14145 [Acidihalobacter sp.]|uniref:hypothetical protein n=1 Tax=Acidihalobacter sp. TaxID=1872108 RepID=UPI00307D7AA2
MRFIHCDAAPIGHSSPHQLRPTSSTDRNTSGNHSAQISQLANRPSSAPASPGSHTGPAISVRNPNAIAAWTHGR